MGLVLAVLQELRSCSDEARSARLACSVCSHLCSNGDLDGDERKPWLLHTATIHADRSKYCSRSETLRRCCARSCNRQQTTASGSTPFQFYPSLCRALHKPSPVDLSSRELWALEIVYRFFLSIPPRFYHTLAPARPSSLLPTAMLPKVLPRKPAPT